LSIDALELVNERLQLCALNSTDLVVSERI
jgi:hypothetical protein